MSRQRARQLRKDMTEAERALWAKLRRRQVLGHKFRRQQQLGAYVVDFVCLDKKLVVELDGGQHARRHDCDAQRTRWLEAQGFEVLRFWNHHTPGAVRARCRAPGRRGCTGPPHPPRLRRVDLPREGGGGVTAWNAR
jgi:very-short-patch-repair endonuclease